MSDLDLKSLFQQHARALQSFLLRKSRDPNLAADLVQESFLRLSEQARHDYIDNSPAYLYRTARNLVCPGLSVHDPDQTTFSRIFQT